MSQTKKYPIEPLTKEECRALIDACGKSKSGIRLAALIMVMYRAGLRVSEALSLRTKDINGCTIRVNLGKGSKSRTCQIDEHGCKYLKRWMEIQKTLGTDLIFCAYSKNSVGAPLDTRNVRNAITRLKKKAGIQKRVHPHGFRHTFASELSAEGAPVNDIRILLGHTSLSMTAKYLSELHPGAALETVANRQPAW